MESPVATATEEAGATPTATPESGATEEPTAAPTATTAPAEPTATSEPQPTAAPTATGDSGTVTYYVVQPGDNLFRIALRFNMTAQALARANNITNPSLVYVGQRIKIPACDDCAPSPPEDPPATGDCQTVHVVQPGENLFRIALRYNYSQYYIAKINNIPNPSQIYVGQKICIP
jgi:LysM repeat protein